MRTRTFLLSALAAAALPAAAWGVTGHRLLAAASLKDLPPAPAAWFIGQEEVLPDHANDPDHWKGQDPQEGPRHFLDSEQYGGASQVPLDEAAAQSQLGPDLFQSSGQVPWVVLDRVQQLAAAFTAGNPYQVALQASYLSHYVGDLQVPLHTSSNYNGDATGQHGVHARWEVGLIERIEAREGWTLEVRPAPAPDPAAPWAWLQESFSLVPQVLADDLTALAAGSGEGHWVKFLALEEPTVKERLNLGAQRTAQMILMAWTQAGSPDVPQPSRYSHPPSKATRGASTRTQAR